MRLTERDRRALILLAVMGALILGYYFWSGDDDSGVAGASVDNIPAAEKRLRRVKVLAASVPGKQIALAQVSKELAAREQGLIQADTAAQAQAQLLQIVKKVARGQSEPIDLRNTELGAIKKFGDGEYGEVYVSVNFECGVEQLLNFLAGLTAQKELIGTTDIRIGAANPKQKTMPVRITISGLTRPELVADKKAGV